MARSKSKARGKHAAPDGIGNVGSYGITSGWHARGQAGRGTVVPDDSNELDSLPYVPDVSTFDIESGAHVATQVPPDETRFGRAWRDPEPDVPIRLPHQNDDDGRGHNIPGEGRSRSVARPIVAFVLLLIATACVAAYGAYGAELWGGKRIPNLVGTSEGNARAVLLERGLQVEVATVPVDDGVGFVLASDPVAGERVEVGGVVTITVGVARVVPPVAGMTEQEARQALVDAGAVEVRATYQAWDAPEGSVVAVVPPEGSSFTSRDTVLITVAQAFTVPDIVGLTRSEALAAVADAGLVATVVEVPAGGATVGTVTATEPEVGTKLAAGAEVVVRVAVGSPSSFEHVAEYFGAAPTTIAAYVAGQGFTLKSGWLNDTNEAQALYTSDERGRLVFTSRPYSHAFDVTHGDAASDVLADGNKFVGVRWEVPAAMLPDGTRQLSDSATAALVATCGLSGESDACNQDNIVIPAGSVKSGANFTCVYGESGGLAWTVLITNAEPMRAVVTCAPRSLYDAYDLKPYGGRVCCLVAYADMYTE